MRTVFVWIHVLHGSESYRNMRLITITALILLLHCSDANLKIRRMIASFPIFLGLTSCSVEAAELSKETIPMTTIQDQLVEMQKLKVENQRVILESNVNAMKTKQIFYPEGKLIATGVITLKADSISDPKLYPLGFDSIKFYENYDVPTSNIFILAVGKDGPPLAAKKIPLYKNDLHFPLVFEITTDDLLFPYTPNAYIQSSNSKDSIAVTVLVTPNVKISEPSPSVLVGFGLSEPVTVAGVLTRSPSQISINANSKVNIDLYTDEEKNILDTIDMALQSTTDSEVIAKRI